MRRAIHCFGPFAALLLAWILLVSPIDAEPADNAALTLDEVLARYAEARGGHDAWKAVESLEIRGHYTALSLREPFREWRQRPHFYRFETDILEMPTIHAHDSEAPWWIEPVFEFPWARRPLQPFDDQLRRSAALAPRLLTAREDGHRLEFLGPGDVDGEPTLGIRITLTRGAVETWHLSPETFLEVAVDSVTYDYTQTRRPIDKRAWYADFREVDGTGAGAIVVPYRIEQEYLARHTVREISEVVVNPKIDPSTFVMPQSEGMERLRHLAGHWKVTVERRENHNDPWTRQETRSAIRSRLDGAILEEDIHYPAGGETLQALRQLSYDRFQAVYRMTQVDSVSYHMKVFEGGEIDGRIELSNETTQTGWWMSGQEVLERPVLYDLTGEGFKIDWQYSTDGGENWTALVRFTYERLPAG